MIRLQRRPQQGNVFCRENLVVFSLRINLIHQRIVLIIEALVHCDIVMQPPFELYGPVLEQRLQCLVFRVKYIFLAIPGCDPIYINTNERCEVRG